MTTVIRESSARWPWHGNRCARVTSRRFVARRASDSAAIPRRAERPTSRQSAGGYALLRSATHTLLVKIIRFHLIWYIVTSVDYFEFSLSSVSTVLVIVRFQKEPIFVNLKGFFIHPALIDAGLFQQQVRWNHENKNVDLMTKEFFEINSLTIHFLQWYLLFK